MDFLKRLLTVGSLGYILMFFSENIFWSRYKIGDTIGDLIFTWIVYSILAFVFLLIIKKYNVNNIWALFLAGSIFGWINEGIIVQTAYMSFPFQLSWTALAWHSLISVLVGFYLIRKILSENNTKKTIVIFSILGLLWGVWSIWWKIEDGFITPVSHFSLYSIIITMLAIFSYIIFDKSKPNEFNPTILEKILAISCIGFFAVYTVIAVPMSIIIMPLLLILTITALNKNKDTHNMLQSYNNIKPQKYLLLLILPIVAIVVYTLGLNLWIPTNIIFVIITSILGIIMFIISLYKMFKLK